MNNTRLLVVDDEAALLDLCCRKLARLSYETYAAPTGKDALQILEEREIDVLVTDYRMPEMDGCALITKALLVQPLLQSIVITGYSDVKSAIDAMGAGAFDYLQKPIDFNELDVAIKKGLEKRKLIQEVQDKQTQLEEYRDHLEILVERRTLALTETNLKLKEEIEERRRLEDSLREAKTVAENASKAKSEFLANMSHEIRTPMTSAIGLLNLVLETDLSAKQKEYLEMARISNVVMQNLLNDILDFSKIEAGRLSLESVPFNPEKIIESVIHLQHLQAKEKAILLSSVVAGDVPRTLIGDPSRLRQIILNLVSNAIKFTHYGEISIQCGTAVDDAHDQPKQVTLHFSVQDSGVGIDKEKISLIFEAFTQQDSSTTRRYGGVGLGLNICTKLVAMMGGSIWAESEPKKGSTFHFTCRFGKEKTEDEQLHNQSFYDSSDSSRIPDQAAMSVLVVEDDQANQLVIQEILETEGHTVIICSEVITAIQEIAARDFDLVLLDLRLPEISGYEVAYQLREEERKRGVKEGMHLPVIALTGFASEEERQKCLAAGMDDFLAKPFSFEQLASKIRYYAQRKFQQQVYKFNNNKLPIVDPSILTEDVFNEREALHKVSGDTTLLRERIVTLLGEAQKTLTMLHATAVTEDNARAIEQEIQQLKDMAMEAGAISFADELFDLLMQLRKKDYWQDNRSRLEHLGREFGIFRDNAKIQYLCRNIT